CAVAHAAVSVQILRTHLVSAALTLLPDTAIVTADTHTHTHTHTHTQPLHHSFSVVHISTHHTLSVHMSSSFTHTLRHTQINTHTYSFMQKKNTHAKTHPQHTQTQTH